MIATEKRKNRKRTVAQILREAYVRHCRDRATVQALRQHRRKQA
ncbi:MAG: hypothetical protein ACFUZC_07190 [Chthoniobacteraceae bacterium]